MILISCSCFLISKSRVDTATSALLIPTITTIHNKQFMQLNNSVFLRKLCLLVKPLIFLLLCNHVNFFLKKALSCKNCNISTHLYVQGCLTI